jgi:hypothetical protein
VAFTENTGHIWAPVVTPDAQAVSECATQKFMHWATTEQALSGDETRGAQIVLPLSHHAAPFSAKFLPWKRSELVVLHLLHLLLSFKRLHSPMQAVASVLVLNLGTHEHVIVREDIWDADRVHGHVFVHARTELAAALAELYTL